MGEKSNPIVLPFEAYQRRVDARFDPRSSRWAEIYGTQSVRAVIYHQRTIAVVLKWIDCLAPPQRSSVLRAFRL
jgi:hypothetical protein